MKTSIIVLEGTDGSVSFFTNKIGRKNKFYTSESELGIRSRIENLYRTPPPRFFEKILSGLTQKLEDLQN